MKQLKLFFAFACLLCAIKASAQDYKLDGNEVKINADIKFKIATATLLPESDAALLIIKKYLDDKPYISLLRVEGHTDRLTDEYGTRKESSYQTLSEQRALAVCRQLVKLGVDCKRLVAVGFGSQKPVADNSTAEGRTANRRIAFVNVALRGHAIGGLPADGGGKVAEGEVCEEN